MWRTLLGGLVLVAFVGRIEGQTISLEEAPLAKCCFRNDLSMSLSGKITVQQEGKKISLAQTAAARHEFLERVLEAKEGVVEKSARLYQSAEVAITIDKDTTKRNLSAAHALMISQRTRDQLLTFCPQGLLTDEEKELTEHFDTHTLSGLLPGKEVAVGAAWPIATKVTLALCDLEGLVSGNLTGKLGEVQGDMATGTVEGVLQGIGQGAQVSMEIKARYAFSLKEKRIIAVEWKQHEERMQGPINPALTADVVFKLRRTPIIEPNDLNDIALVKALSVPADKMSNILYRDPKGRFELQHARAWHLVGQEDKHVVFRLLSDRGDFVAQVTLAPYTRIQGGKMMDIDEFANMMATSPGWEQEDTLLEKNEKVDVAADNAIKVYRVGAAGKLGGVPAIQYFHLLTGLHGDQMIVTFTLDPKQAPNLPPHDLTLIRSIAFSPAEAAVSKQD